MKSVSGSLTGAAHAGEREIVLIPQPSTSPADPLVLVLSPCHLLPL